MAPLQITALIVVAVAGTLVALVGDPARQVVALSLYGATLAGLFFVFSAPDVALSELAVGAVVLPAVFSLAIARVRRRAP